MMQRMPRQIGEMNWMERWISVQSMMISVEIGTDLGKCTELDVVVGLGRAVLFPGGLAGCEDVLESGDAGSECVPDVVLDTATAEDELMLFAGAA